MASATVLLAALSWAAGATAQSAGPPTDLFARDRGMAVRDRPHPEYEAVGARVGGFVFHPRVETGTEFVDNLYAAPNDARADGVLRLAAGASLRSRWSRHALAVRMEGLARRHASETRENSTGGALDVDGRLDLTRDMDVGFGAGRSRRAEPRGASDALDVSAEPVIFHESQLHVQGRREAGRMKTTLRLDHRALDFRDGQTASGQEVDQDHRDRAVSRLTGRVDYAIGPAAAVFVRGGADRRNYESAPASDSAGGEALLGADFEMGALVRGQVAAGYVRQAYEHPAVRDLQGLAATARIEWFPTQLTTVTATGDRTVEDADQVGLAGSLSSRIAVTVDHELLRNLILTGRLGWRRQGYNGADRRDQRFTAAFEAAYLFNRRYGLGLTASHEQLSSRGQAARAGFKINRLAGALVARF